MAIEPKEWVKVRYRTNKIKTGSIHVSINSDTLRYANIPKGVDLLVKAYPLRTGKGKNKDKNIGRVLLKFKEVKE